MLVPNQVTAHDRYLLPPFNTPIPDLSQQVSSTGHGEDPFITPPLSPASPSVQLAERQSSTRSSGTKQGRSRSSSVDQRLDPGVLRATRKHQRRENSLNSGRIETPSGPLTAEEGDAVDERERYLDVNGEDSDCGSSVDLSTGDQSALSLDDAMDYTRRVLSSS